MSRHRMVRSLNVADILAESENYDYDDYDDYDENEVDKVQMDKGKKIVRDVIGQIEEISDKDIEDALWNFYYNTEDTIAYLLDELHKSKTKKKTIPQNKSRSNKTTPVKKADSVNDMFSFNEPSPDDKVIKAQSKNGTSTPKDKVKNVSSVSSTPSTSSSAPKKTLKSESKEKQTITSDEKDEKDLDDVIEILDDDDDDDKPIRFDMSALSLGSEDEPKTPTKSAASVKSNVNQNSPSNISKSSSKTLSKHKRIDILEEYKKRSADKVMLNLVVVGHVDAGKSTLMGHLLYLLGEVSEKTMKKYERDSSNIGKSSFAYAWVLDETGEERSRGITIDIAITNFETEHRRFTLLDAPGHRDFIPNMISGAAQADVAVLVVDATTGEFEAGFEANGQTKEHALLVRSLGVQQLVVAINKLDTVNWSQDRYNEIMDKLNLFLCQAGFKKDKVTYIPCSGLTGENLLERSKSTLAWYSGPTLVQQIDKFEPPTRLLDKPFRLSVSDFFKGGIGGNMSGVTVAGRIESGTIQIGEDVIIIPGGEHGLVKGLEINGEPSKWAAAGDTVLMTLTGLDIVQFKIGSILCSSSHPVPVTSHFMAQIVVFDVKIPITSGFSVILHRQSLNEPAVITKLIAILDKSTGEVTKKNPRRLPKVSTATVEIKLNRQIPLETYKNNKDLGRIMLRKDGETVAAGIAIEILS